MKRTFVFLLVVLAVFSCKKDEEHQLQDKYPVVTQPVTRIDDTGVTITASVKQYGEKPIVDHGFVWSTNGYPTLSDLHVSLGVLDDGNDFQTRIEHDLKPGQTYYVRAYSATSNFVTYSDQHSFVSQGSAAPVIERVGPSEITCYMQRITVYGKNFSTNKADIQLNLWGWVESASRDSIVINLQHISLGTNTLELNIYSKTATVTFEAVGLIFESVALRTAEVGSIVSIKGRHFNNMRNIYMNTNNGMYYDVKIIEKSDAEVKIEIPILKNGPATLLLMDTYSDLHYLKTLFELPFEIISPWKKLDLTFDLNLYYELLYKTLYHNYQDRLYRLIGRSIYVLDLQSKTQQLATEMPKDPPWVGDPFCFMDGSKFYICTESGAVFYFDVTTKQWTNLPPYCELRVIPNELKFCFATRGKCYIYCNSYYDGYILNEYDPATGLWRKVTVPWQISDHATVATFNEKNYIITSGKIYEFNNLTCFIEEKISGVLNGWSSIAYNNKIYVIGSNSLVEYNPVTNQLRQLKHHIHDVGTIFLWKNLLVTYGGAGGYDHEYLAVNLEEL